MNKILISILISSSIFINSLHSQSSVASVSYNKINKPALVLQMPYDESISESFIVNNLKKTGYDPETKGALFWKQNQVNGFYVFKDVRFEGLSNPVDLYFKVERFGKKSKDESLIYLLISKGNEDFVSSTTDEETFYAAKRFLNGFVESSAVYKSDKDITDEEEVLKDADKEFSKLESDAKDIEKKLRELES
ncbi:MAG: hypothetical protein ACXWV9_04060, partial [Flavisolibacter sp.]